MLLPKKKKNFFIYFILFFIPDFSSGWAFKSGRYRYPEPNDRDTDSVNRDITRFYKNLNEMDFQVSSVRHLVDAQFFIETFMPLELNPLTDEQLLNTPQNLTSVPF